MTKPTYEELEAENKRLHADYGKAVDALHHVQNQRNALDEENMRLRYERDEARYWAKHWRWHYMEVKARLLMENKEHWLPSDDPDWIPF